MNRFSREEQSACAEACEDGKATPLKLSHLNGMDCPTLLANLEGKDAGLVATPRADKCSTEQCSTCVWDGTSCYSRLSPFDDCDACCCRPGGPAPRWEAAALKRGPNDATSTP